MSTLSHKKFEIYFISYYPIISIFGHILQNSIASSSNEIQIRISNFIFVCLCVCPSIHMKRFIMIVASDASSTWYYSRKSPRSGIIMWLCSNVKTNRFFWHWLCFNLNTIIRLNLEKILALKFNFWNDSQSFEVFKLGSLSYSVS